MGKTIRQRAEDWTGLWLVALLGGGVFTFRKLAIVPMTAGLCAAANAPVFCASRVAGLWLQYQQAFGGAALLFGIAGFALGRRWPGMLAMAIGITAVVNYNTAIGIMNAALVAWVSPLTGSYGEGSFFL